MNADIVKQMRAEEADLLRKLEAVRTFLAAYGEAPKGDTSTEGAASKATRSPTRSKSVPITSYQADTRTSVALALMFMATSHGLVKTADLVRAIEAMGHEIGGSNKVNALGALLSRSEDVEGHGKRGWTVYDRENALALARKYAGQYLGSDAQKENEPSSENAVGSDAGEREVQTFPKPWEPPSVQTAHG
tara:strand:- start:851 stop:1420 length:570 start_codon:yes stop_codon:yes gene_type:complete